MKTAGIGPFEITPESEARMHREISAYLEEMRAVGTSDDALFDIGYTVLPPEREHLSLEEQAEIAVASGTLAVKHESGISDGPQWSASNERSYDNGTQSAYEASLYSGINPEDLAA
jgi:hypothetical protein